MTPEEFPTLSRAQVRELDRIAIEEFGLPGVVLMENAGRGASECLLQSLRATPGASVAVLCGAGNNGGDGYVVARHLSEAGHPVTLLECAKPDALSDDAAVYRRVCVAMDLPRLYVETSRTLLDWMASQDELDVFVDAVLGTGFQGKLREPVAGILRAAAVGLERLGAVVVALDAPSGLDVDHGVACPETLPAAYTLTFGANKLAYASGVCEALTGHVTVISIGAPRAVYERLV